MSVCGNNRSQPRVITGKRQSAPGLSLFQRRRRDDLKRRLQQVNPPRSQRVYESRRNAERDSINKIHPNASINFFSSFLFLSLLPSSLPFALPSFLPSLLLFVRQGVREGKGFEPNRVVASFKGTVLRGGGRGWRLEEAGTSSEGWVQIRRVFRPRVVNKKRTNE